MADPILDDRLRESGQRLAEQPLPPGLRARLLAVPAARPARRAPRRAEVAMALATSVALGAVLAGAVLNHRSSKSGPAPVGQRWHETLRVQVTGGPNGALGASGGSAWLTTRGTTHLFRVDAATGRTTLAPTLQPDLPGTGFPDSQSAVLVTADTIWVATDNRLLRLDRESGARLSALPISDVGPTHALIGDGTTLWAASGDVGAVYRIDVATGRVVATIPVRSTPAFEGMRDPGALAALDGMIWVAGEGTTSVAGIDPRTNQVTRTFAIPDVPADIVAADGTLWIAATGRIDRVDPATGRVTATIPVAAGSLATAGGAVWAESGNDVLRIDVASNRVTDRIDVHGAVFALAGDGDAVWVGSGTEPTLSRITRDR